MGRFQLRLIALLFTLSAAAHAREIPLTILFTTDLHGHIWPTEDYEQQADLGGFLRCATRIDAIRAGQTNTLLIDVGDTFQGSPESFLTGGRLMIDGLNFMNYDAWVLGNHEIDWGPETLAGLHDRVEVPFLAANLYFAGSHSNWLPKIQPFVIREFDGVKVGIIGLTTPGIPRWSRPHLLNNALFKGSVDALREVIPAVKDAGADVIIVAGHQGYREAGDDFANEVQTTLSAFPEIDVYLGGHTHKPVEEMTINGALYSQAGYHGIWLGRVDLVYDTVSKTVVSRRGQLERMDASVPFHAGLTARWQSELEAAKIKLDRPIGSVTNHLTVTPDELGRSPMQEFISRAIAEASGADFVLHGSLGDISVPAGPLRYRDVWNIIPYENTVGLLSLTPAQIKEVIAENYARKITPMSLGPFGFSFTVNNDASPGEMIDNLRDASGEPLEARKRYRVAFNSYTLASGGNRYNNLRKLADQPASRLEMLPMDTRSVVVDYIERTSLRSVGGPATAE